MKTSLQRVLLLLLLLVPVTVVDAAQQADSGPVAVKIESYIVSEVTGEDGNKQEKFTQATTARPGQVVEYRVSATNTGETTLPAGTVEIIGPVPQGTHYLEGSATPSSEQRLTEFSADGGQSWSEPPVLVNGEVAKPESYTAVRWTLLSDLEPGKSATFVYRVVVE
ncbi:MAG TPA: hypothetical protein VF171_06505 [Trueperaceae bacterium]